jgi:xylulokinase
MERECVLGLDLGTTTCRCLAFDPQGDIIASASTECPPEHPAPGLAVVHAASWWAAVRQVLGAIVTQLAELGARPVALGVSGLQHAMVPLDEQGQVLAPSMLWMDQRARAQVEWLNGEGLLLVEAVLGAGARASNTPSLPKLRWLSEHQPELLARTHVLLLPKDYVRYRLTGHVGTDPSDAGGTMLYDARTGDWAPGLLELAGVTREQMPPICASDSVAGTVTTEGAAQTGLPVGLPVAVGGGDTMATTLGSGGEQPGRALIYIGTAAWVRRPGPRDRSRFLATATTGAAVRWLRDLLAGARDGWSYDEMMADAAQAPPGAEGLLFLPHLCGERGPVPDPDALGLLAGLSIRHGRGHLARAVLEGTCCHLRWLLEDGAAVAPDAIWVAGGAAHSAVWMQILAEVLGRPVHTPQVAEAGALGAAILAAVAVGLYPYREQAAAAMVHPGPVYAPDPTRAEDYEDVYARWRDIERCWTGH